MDTTFQVTEGTEAFEGAGGGGWELAAIGASSWVFQGKISF